MSSVYKYVSVALPLPIFREFTYSVPESLLENVRVGKRVIVPFGKRKIVGFIMSVEKGAPVKGIREIIKIVDSQIILDEKMLEFGEWLSSEYIVPIGEVLHAMLPFGGDLSSVSNSKEEIHKKGMEDSNTNFQGFLQVKKIIKTIFSTKEVKTPEVLLVMGNSKERIEVYIFAIQETIKRGKQVLLLSPEITFVESLWRKICSYLLKNGSNFPQILLWHHKLSMKQKKDVFAKINRGDCDIVVATRSGILLPFSNLGLILIDEEQDSGHKTWEGNFRYHAREAALVRGEMNKTPVVLGSCCPSIESYYRLKNKIDRMISLEDIERKRGLYKITIVDMRREKEFFSILLKEKIGEILDRGKKVVMFMNQKGYSRYVQCLDCGEIVRCKECRVSMILHKDSDGKTFLLCHYCSAYLKENIDRCGVCFSHRMTSKGIGTEKIEGEIKKLFPNVSLARIEKGNILLSNQWDIIIGTQKVLEIETEKCGLLGVVSVDRGLSISDFRSAEKSIQLLYRLMERVEEGGEIIIQTFLPKHPLMRVLSFEENLFNFYKNEMRIREELRYPPFSILIAVYLSSEDEAFCREEALKIKRNLISLLNLKHLSSGEKEKNCEILGPISTPVSRIKGKYRYMLLLKVMKKGNIIVGVRNILKEILEKRRLKVIVDVDPVEFR